MRAYFPPQFLYWMVLLALLVPRSGQGDEIVNPGDTLELMACIWPPNPGTSVTFEAYDTAYSGFHSHHDVYRPSGSMNPQVEYTMADGCARSTFQAPLVAGQHEIAAYSYAGSDFFLVSVRVSFPYLSALPNHPDYFRTGAQPEHPDGWWGTPNVVARIGTIATQFRQETGLRTGVNDMSLQWGGRFDLGPRYGGAFWGPPHGAHMWGLNADIPYSYLGSLAQRERFGVIASASGGSPLAEDNHYHLRFGY